ncbi:hypothetical protein [Segatella bryantii]|uniref:hypothetical protein n=1 Tax=Segatella bryantii TaxID=77095 RepID=UPI002853631D|nr:hypothetical protein [Segatella bryantii]MDR4931663.1 hypothetical protein [Segatella bryantii]
MKKLMMTMLAAMMIVAASAQQVKTNIKVNGYESKAKIEAAAKAAPGVKQAIYNAKSKTVVVVYDKKKNCSCENSHCCLEGRQETCCSSQENYSQEESSKEEHQKINAESMI